MWPSTVVVPDVLGEHGVEVPLAQDQHAVGELGSDGEYEPFGVAVRPGAPRRDLDCREAHVRQYSVERGRELTYPIADEKPKLADPLPQVEPVSRRSGA